MSGHGRIQRIDGPQRGVLCLSLYAGGVGKSVLLFDSRGVHTAEKRPHGDPADSFIQRLRRRYTGAQLAAIERRGSVLRLRLQTKDMLEYLSVEGGALVARDASGKVVSARRRVATRTWAHDEWSPTEASFPAWTPTSTEAENNAQARLRSAKRKLARTRKKVQAELARAEQAPALRHEADLLMANLHLSLQDNALVVHDWLSGQERTLRVEGSAHAQAEALYKRARRFERGVPHIERRLRELDRRDSKLQELSNALESGVEDDALREHFEAVGIRFQSASPRARAREERLPYRQFRTPEGRVLVGRSSKDNDELTLRVARPGDHWLHVRGRPGSHVVVPLPKGETIHPELLLDAAHLAAHFSPASKESMVDVSHTPRRYVRKRRGTPAGSVFLEREKTIFLRVDPHRIRRLLRDEIR